MDSDPPKSKTAKAASGIAQGIVGIALGALPYLIAWQVFFSDERLQPGHKIFFGLIFGFWIVIIALVVQGIATAVLLIGKYRVAAAGVWLTYPLFAVSVFVHGFLVNIEESRVPPKDYSRIERIRPDAEIRDVLIVIHARNFDPSGFTASQFCKEPCISLLRAGVLESVAKETINHGGGFSVFRYTRDDACRIADQNGKQYWQIERERSAVARQILDLERQLQMSSSETAKHELRAELERAQESKSRMQDRMAAIISEPRIEASLTNWGYLKECITMTFHDAIDYDIRIKYGSDEMGSGASRWGHTDIHGMRDGEPYLMARFEAGGGYGSAGGQFTVADIIVGLTGRPFDTAIAPHPVESIEAEFTRLSAVVEGDAYFWDWVYLANWIDDVIEREAARNDVRRLSLSSDEVDILLSMAPADPQAIREYFFDKVYDHVALQSIDALIDGGAPSAGSGR